MCEYRCAAVVGQFFTGCKGLINRRSMYCTYFNLSTGREHSDSYRVTHCAFVVSCGPGRLVCRCRKREGTMFYESIERSKLWLMLMYHRCHVLSRFRLTACRHYVHEMTISSTQLKFKVAWKVHLGFFLRFNTWWLFFPSSTSGMCRIVEFILFMIHFFSPWGMKWAIDSGCRYFGVVLTVNVFCLSLLWDII